jgi:hypothetical protein
MSPSRWFSALATCSSVQRVLSTPEFSAGRGTAVSSEIRSRREAPMKHEEVRELLYQALETELWGVQVYQTAVRFDLNVDLKKEWHEYL